MKLIQRIGYYLGGFSLGLIVLAFFFNKKRTSCSYGPEARVLKNINSKKLSYSEDFYLEDSVIVKQILKKGQVNFSKSETRKDPCGIYFIEANIEDQKYSMTIENCDSLVNVLSLKR